MMRLDFNKERANTQAHIVATLYNARSHTSRSNHPDLCRVLQGSVDELMLCHGDPGTKQNKFADMVCSLQKSWQSGKCKEKADRKRVLNCSVRWTNSNESHFNADI